MLSCLPFESADRSQIEVVGDDTWGHAILRAAAEGDQRDLIQLGRRYFTELDRLTHPGMTVLEDDLLRLIQQSLNVLKHRVLLRRHALFAKPIELPSTELSGIKHISALMIGLLKSTFCWGGDPETSLELIGATHDLFSWGGLRAPRFAGVRIPNNVPDGAAIFFFAEFGFLALESGVDVENWSLLLPILVRMPALYLRLLELVEPSNIPRPFDEFGVPPGQEGFQEGLQRYAEALRRRFAGLHSAELAAVLGLLARRAFSDVE